MELHTEINRPLVTHLYYPAAPGSKMSSINNVYHSPEVAKRAEMNMDIGRRPLIVFSHGLGGNPEYFSWLLADLVKHLGCVIAAPVHKGSDNAYYEPKIALKAYLRAQDCNMIAETMLLTKFRNIIDESKMWFCGFSQGGYAGLLLAGLNPENYTIPDVNTCGLVEKALCASNEDVQVLVSKCHLEAEMRRNRTSEIFDKFLVISPVLTNYLNLTNQSDNPQLKNKQIFVALGDKDNLVAENAADLEKLPNTTVKHFPEAMHVSFRAQLKGDAINSKQNLYNSLAFDKRKNIAEIHNKLLNEAIKFFTEKDIPVKL